MSSPFLCFCNRSSFWSKCSESSSEIVRSEAEAGSAGIGGAGEKGRQPLFPCFLAVEEGIHGGRSQT